MCQSRNGVVGCVSRFGESTDKTLRRDDRYRQGRAGELYAGAKACVWPKAPSASTVYSPVNNFDRGGKTIDHQINVLRGRNQRRAERHRVDHRA